MYLQGAKFVYEHLKDTIERMVSVKENASKRDLDLANHDVYRIAREVIYAGGESNLSKLDQAVVKGQHMLITGQGGSGKAALLSRWLTSLRKSGRKALIYHFVACASDSACNYLFFFIQID